MAAARGFPRAAVFVSRGSQYDGTERLSRAIGATVPQRLTGGSPHVARRSYGWQDSCNLCIRRACRSADVAFWRRCASLFRLRRRVAGRHHVATSDECKRIPCDALRQRFTVTAQPIRYAAFVLAWRVHTSIFVRVKEIRRAEWGKVCWLSEISERPSRLRLLPGFADRFVLPGQLGLEFLPCITDN